MPSLKDLRNRIGSVKSTRKITSAMKMVAASKLRKAQEAAESAQPYAERMAGILSRLAGAVQAGVEGPKLLTGTGVDRKHLLIVVTADRGLCGGFNGQIIREARSRIQSLTQTGKDVKLMTIGRKARDLLKRDQKERIIESHVEIGKHGLSFDEIEPIVASVLDRYEAGEFDIVTLLYNRFVSVVSQRPRPQQLIPFAGSMEAGSAQKDASYEFEPDEATILENLLPQNVAMQIYRALLDSSAGEQAARMTAMDNATRNAGDMIGKLTLNYNRERQAYITKELTEIVSGAEAL